jgi:DnaJ-class molecular chaperone
MSNVHEASHTTTYVEDGIWCYQCNRLVVMHCLKCGGGGKISVETSFMSNEYKWEPCPECGGTGYINLEQENSKDASHE